VRPAKGCRQIGLPVPTHCACSKRVQPGRAEAALQCLAPTMSAPSSAARARCAPSKLSPVGANERNPQTEAAPGLQTAPKTERPRPEPRRANPSLRRRRRKSRPMHRCPRSQRLPWATTEVCAGVFRTGWCTAAAMTLEKQRPAFFQPACGKAPFWLFVVVRRPRPQVGGPRPAGRLAPRLTPALDRCWRPDAKTARRTFVALASRPASPESPCPLLGGVPPAAGPVNHAVIARPRGRSFPGPCQGGACAVRGALTRVRGRLGGHRAQFPPPRKRED